MTWISRHTLTVAFMLVVAVPAETSAQSVEELRQELSRLESEWQIASELARQADSIRAAKRVTETISIGLVNALVETDNPTLFVEAARLAQAKLARDFGDQLDLLEGLKMHVSLIDGHLSIGNSSGEGLLGASLDENTTPEDLSSILVDAVHNAADLAGDKAWRTWLGTATPRPSSGALDFKSVFAHIATTPFSSAKQCLLGSLDGCQQALGLVETSDPLQTWYDSADRHAAVTNGMRPSSRLQPRRTKIYDRCVQDRDDTACVSVLTEASIAIGPPLLPLARESIVRHALELGGPSAHGRLRSSTGPILERLTRTADTSADSLISSWRAQILDSGGKPTAVSATVALTAVFWTMVFSGLAMRTTRWR